MNFLKTVEPDIFHLDVSLGNLSLEELSSVSLSLLRGSGKVRENILEILPKLMKVAFDIKRVYNIVGAIGEISQLEFLKLLGPPTLCSIPLKR